MQPAVRKMDDRTLFHLIPRNGLATEALSHPDNKRFVSLSAENKPGLEIGFHVPPFSRGHVITRLGRSADLILRESHSSVHLAFEIHPETFVVMLSVRTKNPSSVRVAPDDPYAADDDDGSNGDLLEGDCAIIYGQKSHLHIASYRFTLCWRPLEGANPAESLRRLAMRGYQDSMQRLKDVRSRDQSLPEASSTANSWYMTRLRSSKAPLVREAANSRIVVGEGAFGKVFKTMDRASGNYFAVKMVELDKQDNVEGARASLHREIKILERLSHAHIIECLGSKDFGTERPLIFMPLREGSLHSLVAGRKSTHELCDQVLEQMLSALDYLASQNLCHRDIKPQNILYEPLGQSRYCFQLADFGLANDLRFARTFCGTSLYLPPELYTNKPQSPKMDIWSLFVTIAEIHPQHENFPDWSRLDDPTAVIQAIVATAAAATPQLRPMARVDPQHRASAAQMLRHIYNGRGLTTPASKIPPLALDAAATPLAAVCPQPSRTPPAVIQLPPRRAPRQQQPRRPTQPLFNGCVPNRSPPAGAGAAAFLRAQPAGVVKKQPAAAAAARLRGKLPAAALAAKPPGRLAGLLQREQLEVGKPAAAEAGEKVQTEGFVVDERQAPRRAAQRREKKAAPVVREGEVAEDGENAQALGQRREEKTQSMAYYIPGAFPR
ncbi:kinase-like domain-containing protein [Chaetomium sp. MPI-SDFR-AT-0129]|nr:kinase-like domain-containing protein [Chaetomium sp. MPI-SDFR-AT-0129]